MGVCVVWADAARAQPAITQRPSEVTATITDVRFSSAALVGGARQTDKFHVSVTVSPSQMGGSPPAYVVDTTRMGAKVSGKATLQVNGGTSQLNVSAVNELGEMLQLTVVCKPKS
jgi:hypothetical protein